MGGLTDLMTWEDTALTIITKFYQVKMKYKDHFCSLVLYKCRYRIF